MDSNIFHLVNMELFVWIVGSVIWMIRTKESIKKLGVLRVLILTIVWSAVLFGNWTLMIYVASNFGHYDLATYFQSEPLCMRNIIYFIDGVISMAYWGLTWYGFPAYAILVTVGGGVRFIRKKMHFNDGSV